MTSAAPPRPRPLLHRSTASLPGLLALLLAITLPAAAGKPRLRLERLDPSGLGEDKLRVFASVVELEGEVVDGLNAGEFGLLVDDKSAGRAIALQRFAATSEEVYVAFVVEVAAQYKKAIEPVKTALKEFLEDQPRQFKAMLIAYGSETEVRSPMQPAAALGGPIEDLLCDDDSVDVKMVEAVTIAINELKRIPDRKDGTKPRRLIVLVSDGLNFKMDRETFRKLGATAQKAKIPIHSLAYSPGDERGPLLNLGELSKRSNGTFRWAQKQDDLPAQLATLAEEVRKQYVLTFKSELKTLEGHKFALRHKELRSNRVSGNLFESSTADGKDDGGEQPLWKKWWFWVALILGALVLLYLVGLIVQARGATSTSDAAKQQKAAPPKAARAAAKASGKAPGKASGGAAPAVNPNARATLITIGGAHAGSRFELRGVLVVGKAPGNSIVVTDDPSISSRHCEFGQGPGGFHVTDLGSTNGTFVNNQRLPASGTHRLGDGDIVRLGSETQFKVRID